MREAVIVSGCRTAIGNFGGSFKNTLAVDLGSAVIADTLKRINLRPKISKLMEVAIPEKFKGHDYIQLEKDYYNWSNDDKTVCIDEIIMGNVLQSAQGQNPARQAMIRAGIPKETPAFTVNMVCGSGLKAISLGVLSIMSGESDVVLAGGMENMSLVPMGLTKARWGYRMEISGNGEICDLLVFDGLYEIFYGYHMGITAENIANMYGISRQEQDELGVLSHARAYSAINDGIFFEEIVPITLKTRKGITVVETDERPADINLSKMSKLKPVFKKDGTVTAGNSSGINDGAAAVLLMSNDKAKSLGLKPIVKIKSFKSVGLDPAYMGLGPVSAIKSVLESANMTLSDIDMIDLNEAFAAQAIGCMRELKIDNDYPNELGSGISLGHPIGCTGARQVVTAMNQMKRKNYSTGLVTMCIGGGMGMAMILERQ